MMVRYSRRASSAGGNDCLQQQSLPYTTERIRRSQRLRSSRASDIAVPTFGDQCSPTESLTAPSMFRGDDASSSDPASPWSQSTYSSYSATLTQDGNPPESFPAAHTPDSDQAEQHFANLNLETSPRIQYEDSNSSPAFNHQAGYFNQSLSPSPSAFTDLPPLHRRVPTITTILDGAASALNDGSWHQKIVVAQPEWDTSWKTSSLLQRPAFGEFSTADAYPEQRITYDPGTSQEESAWSGICGKCNAIGFYCEGSWLLHLWTAHPEGAEWVPGYCVSSCADRTTVYNKKGSWVTHAWRSHREWAEWAPTKCMWEDCTLPKLFLKRTEWLNHSRTVHQKSYYCRNQGCELRRGGRCEKAFGAKHDLSRHELTHVPAVPCAKPNCQGRRHSDIRRGDKKAVHEFKWHGPLPCRVDGCLRRRIAGIDHGFSSKEDLEKHLREKHHQYDTL